MKKYIFLVSIISVLTIIIINGCKKKEVENPPTISFKTGAGYTQNGAVVMVGHKLSFGIQAQGTSAVITNFTVKKVLTNGSVVTMMDTGMYNSNLNLNLTFYQNVETQATWVFTVMDKNRMTASISMVVYKDPNSTYGGIYYYPSITLGYQTNTVYGHFLDPYTGQVYSTDSANTNQTKVNMLIYYELTNTPPTPVLSSAGEMDNGSLDAETYYPNIANWSTRNYTAWDISLDNGTNAPLTPSDFFSAQNDSLLIVSYHPVWGKMKFRYATAGKIVPFQTTTGKFGLIHIISADSSASGKMVIDLKIQQ